MDFFDLRFEAILLKSRPIGTEQQLGFALAWHVLRNYVTVLLMSDDKMILYHPMEWRKRLVYKKNQVSASSWIRQTSSYE